MKKIYSETMTLALKIGVVGLASISLIASGNTSGSGGGSNPPANLLGLGITPDQTISQNSLSLTVSTNGNISTLNFVATANNKARANTQYYDATSGQWTRVAAHTLILTGGATIIGTMDTNNLNVTLTQVSIGSGSSSKLEILLKSPTEIVKFEIPAVSLNNSQLANISAVINNNVSTFSSLTLQQMINLVQSTLQQNGVGLPTDLSSIVSQALNDIQNNNSKVGGTMLPLNYQGIGLSQINSSLSNGASGNTQGLFGGFGYEKNGSQQFTAFYAKEDGATHIDASSGTNTTNEVYFAGASNIGNAVGTLFGKGNVEIDYTAGTLKTDTTGIVIVDDTNNTSNNKLSFNLSYDGSDKLFKSNSASYVAANGGPTVTGNAEAAIFEKNGTKSILGMVDLRTGNNVVVGGFGSKPIVKDTNGVVISY